jgi:hypothetical protein
LCLLALLGLSVHCGWLSPPADLRLQPTLESPEAVASAVLEGLRSADLSSLRQLALTENEFHVLVWPKLPASRPERNVPWDYAWNDLAAKSDANLRARLSGWQDRGYTVVNVAFTGGVTDYETFRVHRDTVLTLRDGQGNVSKGRLLGSMIEQAGRFKVFSYVVD